MSALAAPIRRVVIAGGGTAGWMAAAALSRLSQAGRAEVILVESDEIGTVGVGESTIPSLHDFHAMLDVSEAEFMRATGATFKLGIQFTDWGRLGETYLHPFGSYGVDAQGVQFHQLWLRLSRSPGLAGEIGPIGLYNLTHQAALAGRCPPAAAGGEATISYAYHLDAGRYAQWLRGYAETRGVRRIEGRIDGVSLNGPNGFIEALHLTGDRSVDGDLFVDCTGFRGLLIGEALGAAYDDWRHWLPCDRAWAVPTAAVEPPRAYTRAMADAAGWRWRIPLQHRVGNGYVYCSDMLGDEAARDRLLATLEGEPLAEPRLLRFTAGCREQLWIRNCVAIGLSAGFIEPLESTSIHLIQRGVARLLALFPDQGCDAVERAVYNDGMVSEYRQVRDFIILHYKLTERNDAPFWDRVRDMDVPASLAEKMALFGRRARLVQGKPDLFTPDSWIAVMLGQGLRPSGHDPLADALPLEESRRFLTILRKRVAEGVKGLPDHGRALADRFGDPHPAVTAAPTPGPSRQRL